MANEHAQNLRIAATLVEINDPSAANLASDIRAAADEIDRLERAWHLHPINAFVLSLMIGGGLALGVIGGGGIAALVNTLYHLLGGL